MAKESDAIYQNGEKVGQVIGAEMDEANKKFTFAEIHHSDYLLLPEECDYQKFRIQIHDVEYATREGTEAAQKGRILRKLAGEILGYSEQ